MNLPSFLLLSDFIDLWKNSSASFNYHKLILYFKCGEKSVLKHNTLSGIVPNVNADRLKKYCFLLKLLFKNIFWPIGNLKTKAHKVQSVLDIDFKVLDKNDFYCKQFHYMP